MNPILRARIEQYNALRASVSAIHDAVSAERRQLTDDEQERIFHARTELERLVAEGLTEEDVTEHQRHADVAAVAARVAAGTPGAHDLQRVGAGPAAEQEPPRDVVPGLMPSAGQLRQALQVIENRSAMRAVVDAGDLHTRATVTTAQTGEAVAAIAGAPLREPRRIASAVPLTVARVDGTSSLAFPKFGAGTAGIQTEGALKAEYSAITAGSAEPQMIAVWTDVTRQALMGMSGLEQRIRAKLAALVARREDQLMVAQLQASGAQALAVTEAAPYSDSLLAACGLVLASDVAAAPDLILVNPTDLPLIFPAATTQGLNGTSPDSAMRLELHGATVYPTSAVTAGNAIVAALGASARYVIGMAPELVVDAQANVKTNTVTMLMEEAVTLAVDEPSGVVLVDLVAP